MMIKVDKSLAKILTSQTNNDIDCLIYVKNFQIVEKYLHTHKIKIVGKYPFINAFAIKTSLQKVKKILTLNHVKFISSQVQVFAMMNIAKKILGTESWGQGENQTIAFIDTGVSPHLDFVLGDNRIIKFVDLINNHSSPYDDNGHGTFVCGVASGSGLASNGKFAGICPKSKIVAIKALDAMGEANTNKILDAMQWVFDNAKKFNIKIVCMSFGSESLGLQDPIMKGAEKLWENGIVVVAAAGNSGPAYQTIKSPGTSSKIITVGGFNDNRYDDIYNPLFFEIAEFSSCGPAFQSYKPDLVAPAVDITSCGIENFYTILSGTSVATPMVAGLSALLLEKKPELTPAQIKKILMHFCTPITFNKNKEGEGRVSLPKY